MYTVLGGMVSIVITDFIQFVALSVGTILVTLWSVHATGFTRMYDAVRQTMGTGGFNPFTNPDYGWAYIAFQVLIWLAVHTCWQTTAMRTFSTRSPEIAKRVFSWAGFIFLGRGMMPMMWGIAALALLGPVAEFAGSDAAHAGDDTAFRASWDWSWLVCWPRPCRSTAPICWAGARSLRKTSSDRCARRRSLRGSR